MIKLNDVYNNSYDWLNELDNNIKKIIKENKVQNVFLCKNNEYTIYHYKVINIINTIYLIINIPL